MAQAKLPAAALGGFVAASFLALGLLALLALLTSPNPGAHIRPPRDAVQFDLLATRPVHKRNVAVIVSSNGYGLGRKKKVRLGMGGLKRLATTM